MISEELASMKEGMTYLCWMAEYSAVQGLSKEIGKSVCLPVELVVSSQLMVEMYKPSFEGFPSSLIESLHTSIVNNVVLFSIVVDLLHF